MLIEFKVKNFKSFRDEICVNMLTDSSLRAENKVLSLQNQVAKQAYGFKYDILKTAVFFGPNASGKSNLVESVDWFHSIVSNSFDPEMSIGAFHRPFSLDENSEKAPTVFEITFIHEQPYRYGFSYNSEGVIKEWFYSYPKGRERLLFKRNVMENRLRFGSDFKGLKSLLKRAGSGRLVLTHAAINGFTDALNAYVGIVTKTLTEASHDTSLEYSLQQAHGDKLWSNEISQQMKVADFHINGIDIGKKTGEVKKGESKFELAFQHSKVTKEGEMAQVTFPSHDESDGTLRYFSLLGPIHDLYTIGNVAIFDELDMHLHSNLTKHLIREFCKKSTNGQLLFTTHDLSLMDLKLFRRDQIWFFDKDESGASTLTSLADFDVRQSSDALKMYLEGRFAALPLIEESDDE